MNEQEMKNILDDLWLKGYNKAMQTAIDIINNSNSNNEMIKKILNLMENKNDDTKTN